MKISDNVAETMLIYASKIVHPLIKYSLLTAVKSERQ